MDVNASKIFLNSDYVVIEYIDFIKSPYLLLLGQIRNQLRFKNKNFRLQDVIDGDQIMYLNDASLYEWYINRKHQNFYLDLNKYPDKISSQEWDQLLEDQMNSFHQFYTDADFLALADTVKIISARGYVKDIIFYHPHKNNFAQQDIERAFGKKFTFMNNFDEVLDLAKENSTYFLSDINKINIMQQKNLLKYSSVTLPIEYRYNKKDMTNFKLDFKSLYKTDVFKLTLMRACTYEEE